LARRAELGARPLIRKIARQHDEVRARPQRAKMRDDALEPRSAARVAVVEIVDNGEAKAVRVRLVRRHAARRERRCEERARAEAQELATGTGVHDKSAGFTLPHSSPAAG